MLYSIRDTMGALSIGRTSVYNLIKTGRLEAVKLGSRTLIKVSSINALVEANGLDS
jgi:excisionase family DNA binding protein